MQFSVIAPYLSFIFNAFKEHFSITCFKKDKNKIKKGFLCI